MHNFATSLRESEEQADAAWWEIVYRQAFPDFAGMYSVRGEGWGQASGIDRVIQLTTGRTVTIDEKVRAKTWHDIALEYWSVWPTQPWRKKVPGWAVKGKACDYLAYAFIPTQRCYLLPYLDVQRAFKVHGNDWVRKGQTGKDGFRIVRAPNPGYDTISVAVPTPVLMSAIQQGQIVGWQ